MKIVALAGGVGGAKLVEGLAQVLNPQELSIIVNTADDFRHLGLAISPDLDTVCYTLAGISNPITGWGRMNDTFHFLEALKDLGGDTWFMIGDLDLATHIERTERLQAGQSLSEITRSFCRVWGVKPLVLPMSDDQVHTVVNTLEYGEIHFQEYFVLRQCMPRIKGIRFAGIQEAKPSPGVLEAIRTADVVVICPSNPWVSIDPILMIQGILHELKNKLVVAISPIIGGKSVKGPAAKMFQELNFESSAGAVVEHYGGILKAFVLDQIDVDLVEKISIPVLVTDTLMTTGIERRRLAENVLNFLRSL